MKYAALLLLAFLQVILSITLSYKRKSSTSKWFAIFASVLAVWTVFNVLLDYNQYYAQGSVETLDMLNTLGFFWGILALICVYRLTLVFPIEKKLDRNAKIVIAIGFLLAVCSVLESISGSFVYQEQDKVATYTYGSTVSLVGIYSLFLVIMCIKNIANAYSKSIDRNVRKQATLLFAGLILTVVTAITFIVVIPSIFPEEQSLIFIGYFAPFIFAASMFYSIFAQQFLDFRSVVARSMGYIMSLTFLGVTYGVTAFIILDNLLLDPQTTTLTQRRATYVALALLFGLSFAPAKRLFDKLSNKIFYRDAYDSQAFIDAFTSILVTNANINELLGASAELINNNLKPKFTDFALQSNKSNFSFFRGEAVKSLDKDTISDLFSCVSKSEDTVFAVDDKSLDLPKHTDKKIRQKGIELIVKLSDHGEVIGLVLIGHKRSGNIYSGKDKEIFEIVADELSLAIQNSLRYEEIAKFNITLQEEVEDATKRLRSTNAKLRSLDETKDEFISMASHQLRTPLTSIKGYISMVLEGDAGKLNDQQKKMLSQAFVSSQRMNYLISDLLNVSRLKTGKFEIENKPTSLPEVIQGELDQLYDTAKVRGLQINFDPPKDFPVLSLDETKIRQVIMNFVDNAIYYTGAGGQITIDISTNSKTVELKVIDTGLGVPKKEQHNLFSKFYRADNARRARPDGTGLGLFMAKKVVIAQGGAIIFKSIEGKGSTFGFSFPISKVTVEK